MDAPKTIEEHWSRWYALQNAAAHDMKWNRRIKLRREEDMEKDPNGIDQHAPGAKLDEGKLLANILQQYPRALTAVLEVATHGAEKYTRGGWQSVENGVERYSDAMMRHYLKEGYERMDEDSGLLHMAHLAWNALSRLELTLREEENK
jgi:hypothetical protein